MPDELKTPVTTPVTDRRPVPQGVLPRGVQTWLMAGLAAAMLLIIVLTGRPDAPPPVRQATATPATADPDRVREYQDRLRLLEAQAAQPVELPEGEPPLPPSFEDDVAAPPRVDPVDSERKRREYESLFASNVVLSRRPDGQRPDGGAATRRIGTGVTPLAPDQPPSIEAIADAVARATRTQAGAATDFGNVQATAQQIAPMPVSGGNTPASSVSGPLQPSSPNRVLEGTLIDAVLTNRLDGGMAAPVSCLVTNPVYALSGRDVLIPAGARVLGETRPVQALGETRLAVLFHRLILPDGRTLALDQFKGLNQIGDAGLRDKVNHHYWSTLGAAAAVGLVSGLSQLIGTAGLGLGDGDRTVVVAGSAADASAQATAQVMTRFMNRLPTVTIREGHRVKVYVTSDLELPVWASATNVPGR